MRQGWWVQRTEPSQRQGLSSSPCRTHTTSPSGDPHVQLEGPEATSTRVSHHFYVFTELYRYCLFVVWENIKNEDQSIYKCEVWKLHLRFLSFNWGFFFCWTEACRRRGSITTGNVTVFIPSVYPEHRAWRRAQHHTLPTATLIICTLTTIHLPQQHWKAPVQPAHARLIRLFSTTD